MSIDAFSNFIKTPQTAVKPATPPAQQVAAPVVEQPVVQQIVEAPVATAPVQATVQEDKKTSAMDVIKKAAPIVVPLAAIPISVVLANKTAGKTAVKAATEAAKDLYEKSADEISKKVTAALTETINNNKDEITKIATEAKDTVNKNSSDIWKVIAGIGAGLGVGSIIKDDKTDVDSVAKKLENAGKAQISRTDAALSQASIAANSSPNVLGSKYVKDFNGIPLLNTPSNSRDKNKYNKAIELIQTAAPERLYNKPKIKPIEKQNPTIWSVTSEFAPVKEGGLGSVPVEVQANATKLGVDMPTILPMYQQKGVAGFTQKVVKYTEKVGKKEIPLEKTQYQYKYKDTIFFLEKVASYKVDSFQAGKPHSEEVEIFASVKKSVFNKKKGIYEDENINPLLFVKNDKYFNGTIYEKNEKTEEPEKFAFFSKAVYELMKIKEDVENGKDVKIFDKASFDSLKSPDALILNDWQASPIAALARYKAPMEYAHGQLKGKTINTKEIVDGEEKDKEITVLDRISNMNIITIGHNAQYQGSTADNNSTEQKCQATSNILNTLFDNYAYDIVTNAKTEAYRKAPKEDAGLKNLDNTLVLNADNTAWNHTNLLNMGIVLSDYFCPVSKNYAKELISTGHEDLAGELQWAMVQKNNSDRLIGVINGNDFDNLSIEAKHNDIKSKTDLDFKVYKDENGKWDINSVLEARKTNKSNFYNNYITPFTFKNSDDKSPLVQKVRDLTSGDFKLEYVDPSKTSKLPTLTDEELEKTPIISMVGRFVTQKGIDIMSDAIDKLYKNWDKDFPGQNKPIFYIAGSDGEGGKQRAYIEDLKQNKLSQEDSDRVVFAHGFAPMQAFVSASDFFLMPSRFEPCGLTQGEACAVGTPVIASAVGGIVDTLNRDGKTNAVLTDQNKKLDSDEFYKAMKQGLDIYFNDKNKYNQMINDAYSEDFSWILPNKQGPVYDYLELIGMDKNKLPELSEIKKA